MKNVIFLAGILSTLGASADTKYCGKVLAVSARDDGPYYISTSIDKGTHYALSANLISIATAALANNVYVCVNDDFKQKGLVNYISAINP